MTADNSLHIDDDWKAQAKAEKERLAEKRREAQRVDAQKSQQAMGNVASQESAQAVPEASFDSLVRLLASRAMMAMGGGVDQTTGRPIMDPDTAKYYIDHLAILADKTQNNLNDAERITLSGVLYELRNNWIRVAWQSRSTAV